MASVYELLYFYFGNMSFLFYCACAVCAYNYDMVDIFFYRGVRGACKQSMHRSVRLMAIVGGGVFR